MKKEPIDTISLLTFKEGNLKFLAAMTRFGIDYIEREFKEATGVINIVDGGFELVAKVFEYRDDET